MVPKEHLVSEALGDFVALDVDVLVEVDHRLHDHPGRVRASAPGGDLPSGEQLPAGVLQPCHRIRVVAADRVLGQVHDEHHLTTRAGPGGRACRSLRSARLSDG